MSERTTLVVVCICIIVGFAVLWQLIRENFGTNFLINLGAGLGVVTGLAGLLLVALGYA